jgi:23S rRNA pseudouridine2605 synthase
MERLQAYLAHAGACSRREGERLILAGRVAVNGRVVTELGTKVGEGDVVSLDGNALRPEKRLHYLALNKPPGYLCSQSDPENRPLALSLLPPRIRERIYNVGRLDFRSSGLIIFTNDGEFAARLTHPSSEIEKEYFVEATAAIPDALFEGFLAGLDVEGVFYKAASVERRGKKSLTVTLIEGKNREIRRVFSHFHLHPRTLRRIRIGAVQLGALPEGQTRPLTEGELANLK